MKLVDLNLLLYAYNADADKHAPARAWLQSALVDEEPLGLSWAVLLGFLRISTNVRIQAPGLTMPEARSVVNELLSAPSTVVLQPGASHWTELEDLLEEGGVTAAMVTDAHLAALAVEHQATVYTTDADFLRFQSVRSVNPIAE